MRSHARSRAFGLAGSRTWSRHRSQLPNGKRRLPQKAPKWSIPKGMAMREKSRRKRCARACHRDSCPSHAAIASIRTSWQSNVEPSRNLTQTRWPFGGAETTSANAYWTPPTSNIMQTFLPLQSSSGGTAPSGSARCAGIGKTYRKMDPIDLRGTRLTNSTFGRQLSAFSISFDSASGHLYFTISLI